jgi:hypothetical protein
MVADCCVLFSVCYHPFTGVATQTVQSGNNERFSPVEQHDQNGNVYRHSVYSVFWMIRIEKTLNDSRKLFTFNFLLLTFNEENYTRITIAPEKDAT